MNSQDLQKQIKKTLGESVGAVMADEFVQVMQTFTALIKELKTQLETEISSGDTQVKNMCQKMMSDMDKMESDMKKMVDSKVSSSEMSKIMKSLIGEIEQIRQSIPSMPDLSVYESKLEEIKASIPVIKDTILDNGIQIRDKLESIKTESEKLSINSISELRKELDELKKIRSTGRSIFGGGMQYLAGTGLTIEGNVISSSITSVGYQVPTGDVDGNNRTFVFAVAPNVIVVDGGTMRKLQSDGVSANWTGTTTVVMTSAPNSDIYSIA